MPELPKTWAGSNWNCLPIISSDVRLPTILTIALLLGLVGSITMQPSRAMAQSDYCLGEPPTIVHVGYDATIVGTDGDDVIVIDGGWNMVYAGDGDDKICILGHFNSVFAETGDDALITSGLHNNLSGGDDDDRLTVDDLSNIMDGGSGDNRCNGDSC